MIFSERLRFLLLGALGLPEMVDELEAELNSLLSKENELIAAYTALLNKLNNDTGVSDTDFGSGPEEPPSTL